MFWSRLVITNLNDGCRRDQFMRVSMKICRCFDWEGSDPHSSKASRTTMGDRIAPVACLFSRDTAKGSWIKYMKCFAMSALAGSTLPSFKFSISLSAKNESFRAKSKATVRHNAAGSLKAISPRLKKKLETTSSPNCDTNVEAIVDLPEPGLPLSQRMLLGAS